MLAPESLTQRDVLCSLTPHGLLISPGRDAAADAELLHRALQTHTEDPKSAFAASTRLK
jgi:hypothetical protein